MLLLGVAFAGVPNAAAAAQQLHGLVLQVDASKSTAIVRHDAIGGTMPAMTMTFRLDPAVARRVHAGDTIEAAVDTSTEPWSLHGLLVVPATRVSNARQIPARDVRALRIGDKLPATQFVDQRGRAFDLQQLRGQTVILAFIFTRCQDPRECPLISANFHAVQEKLRGGAFHLVEVTLDPIYDRPPVLARYGRTFGADPERWSILTGDPDAIFDFAAQFSVTAFPDDRAGLIHTDRTVVADGSGTIRQLIDETGWSPDELVASARHEANLSSNPFARFNLWLTQYAVAICGNGVAGYSGLLDLLIVLLVFGGSGWAMWRIARHLARA